MNDFQTFSSYDVHQFNNHNLNMKWRDFQELGQKVNYLKLTLTRKSNVP